MTFLTLACYNVIACTKSRKEIFTIKSLARLLMLHLICHAFACKLPVQKGFNKCIHTLVKRSFKTLSLASYSLKYLILKMKLNKKFFCTFDAREIIIKLSLNFAEIYKLLLQFTPKQLGSK